MGACHDYLENLAILVQLFWTIGKTRLIVIVEVFLHNPNFCQNLVSVKPRPGLYDFCE